LNDITLQFKSGLILRSFKHGNMIYDTPESPITTYGFVEFEKFYGLL